MIANRFKAPVTAFITPICKAMLSVGITANGLTVVGALGGVLSALFFFSQGEFFIGTVVVSLFALSDLFDGTLARLSQQGSTKWGALIDSTLDRITDAAICAGILVFAYSQGGMSLTVYLALTALITGSLIPYIRARAESLGIECSVGIAERAVFESLAGISYRRNGKRVQRLRINYRHVAPDVSVVELEEMVKDGLRSAMRYWCDTFRISDWSTEKTLHSTVTNNENFLFEPIEKKRGVIVAVPHAGNWDHAGAYFCAKGARVNTVAEHLKPERLFRKFLAHRERMGMNVLDLDAGVLNELEMILKDRGELVALVSDRDLSKSGIDVHFFGATARMPAGPARLAYDTGADLITAFVAYRREGIEVFFTPPITVDRAADKNREIARVTQVIASRFEDAIRKNPTSWHMQQRIFIDKDFVERP